MKINVSHIAKLASLPLTSEEKIKFEKQLEETIIHVENLSRVDTKGIEPTSQVTGLENITRDDEAKPSLTQEEALFNTKSKHNGLFKVDAIFEENES
jgi:aspartyl-tRNA(Asn)/glutamyl-tRNA(Gln) amidotransferase subunit C